MKLIGHSNDRINLLGANLHWNYKNIFIFFNVQKIDFDCLILQDINLNVTGCGANIHSSYKTAKTIYDAFIHSYELLIALHWTSNIEHWTTIQNYSGILIFRGFLYARDSFELEQFYTPSIESVEHRNELRNKISYCARITIDCMTWRTNFLIFPYNFFFALFLYYEVWELLCFNSFAGCSRSKQKQLCPLVDVCRKMIPCNFHMKSFGAQ